MLPNGEFLKPGAFFLFFLGSGGIFFSLGILDRCSRQRPAKSRPTPRCSLPLIHSRRPHASLAEHVGPTRWPAAAILSARRRRLPAVCSANAGAGRAAIPGRAHGRQPVPIRTAAAISAAATAAIPTATASIHAPATGIHAPTTGIHAPRAGFHATTTGIHAPTTGIHATTAAGIHSTTAAGIHSTAAGIHASTAAGIHTTTAAGIHATAAASIHAAGTASIHATATASIHATTAASIRVAGTASIRITATTADSIAPRHVRARGRIWRRRASAHGRASGADSRIRAAKHGASSSSCCGRDTCWQSSVISLFFPPPCRSFFIRGSGHAGAGQPTTASKAASANRQDERTSSARGDFFRVVCGGRSLQTGF